ncbi:hypothetical protein AGMMS50268_09110 [Spirochaetia bacterium]|nr:hypothetical protein AGMMS50268_09110 [Spirochaetia bacterium]
MDDTYRLKYRDAEGTVSVREIQVIQVERGDGSASSYLRAFCFSAKAMRTFRFDRIKALYDGKERIKDPLEFMAEKYGEAVIHEVDTESLVAEALREGDTASTPPPAPPRPLDIPKAKKKRRNRYITAAILGVASIASFISASIGWGIAYLVGAAFFVLAGLTINGHISAAEVKPEVNPPAQGQ